MRDSTSSPGSMVGALPVSLAASAAALSPGLSPGLSPAGPACLPPELALWLDPAPPGPDDPPLPLRALDRAFARFLHQLCPSAPPSLLAAAALLAHLEGRGHACLPLATLLHRPEQLADGARADTAAVLALARLARAGATQVTTLVAAWGGCPLVQLATAAHPAPAQPEPTPLVLHGGRLYLRRYWVHETGVAAQVRARATARCPVDPAPARAALDRLFPPDEQALASADPAARIDWQKVACALALRGRLALITGGPGTGKTYTAARLLVLQQQLHDGPEPLRVALAAPTGKAAARLRQSIEQALQQLQARFGDTLPLDRWREQLGPARTLHRLLGARPGTRLFRHDAAHPLDLDLLFVDEASMVHLEMMASLLDALPPTARVVLLGDKDQLASVEAGAVLGDLCHGAAEGGYDAGTQAWLQALTGQALPAHVLGDGGPLAQQTAMLRQSKRFAGAIGALARAVNQGDAAAAQALFDGGSHPSPAVAWLQAEARPAGPGTGSSGSEGAGPGAALQTLVLDGRPMPGADPDGAPDTVAVGYRPCLALLAQRPASADSSSEGFAAWALQVLAAFDRFRVLAALRDGPWGVTGLNVAIERTLLAAGLLQPRGEWYEGRPVMVTRNDPDLGVYNGDIGLVLRAPASQVGGGLRAWFADGQQLRSVAVGRLAEVQTAWAMTVHKSQGSEFGHVALVLPPEPSPVLTRELVYTGITRARQAFTLLGAHRAVLDDAIQRLTQRASGLRDLL